MIDIDTNAVVVRSRFNLPIVLKPIEAQNQSDLPIVVEPIEAQNQSDLPIVAQNENHCWFISYGTDHQGLIRNNYKYEIGTPYFEGPLYFFRDA